MDVIRWFKLYIYAADFHHLVAERIPYLHDHKKHKQIKMEIHLISQQWPIQMK